ncbi:MAG: endo alpha-1,4 polygalactosaminidase, partial [Pseudomonadota bacterium]
DEKYVDMADRSHVWPLMKARIDACAAKGFVGVEPDNMGAHDNDTGFAFTSADAVLFFKEMAHHAHDKGLKILQKNADEIVPQLVGLFDGMLVEECFHYEFCEEILPYIDAGKPVLAVEYTENGGDWSAYCRAAKAHGFHLLLNSYEVTAGGEVCH